MNKKKKRTEREGENERTGREEEQRERGLIERGETKRKTQSFGNLLA